MTSELDIENHLIQILSEQENQWRYRPDLTSEAALWENFRRHLNRLNLAILEGEALTDIEFNRVRHVTSALKSHFFLYVSLF